MSLELLSKLETKIQAALETIELLKMELEEEKQANTGLKEQNQQLQQELNSWNEKVTGLVGLLNDEAEALPVQPIPMTTKQSNEKAAIVKRVVERVKEKKQAEKSLEGRLGCGRCRPLGRGNIGAVRDRALSRAGRSSRPRARLCRLPPPALEGRYR